MGNTLKLAVTAVPEKGKANQAVIEVLSQALDVPRSSISIIRGESATTKLAEISRLSEAEVFTRLHKPLS